MMPTLRLSLLLLPVTLACAPAPGDDAGVDAGGSADAGQRDGGAGDGGPGDGGSVDAGGVDAGGADAGASDAGRGDAGLGGSRFWDGGACTRREDCPCFSSDDCAPTFTCRSFDTTGLQVYCVPGARGPGALGAPCTGEADCASALCVDLRDGGQRCSALCERTQDCVPELPRCLALGFGIDRALCSPP